MSKEFHEPEDFLCDESFLAWYFEPGREEDGSWENWMSGAAGRRELVDRAVAMLDAARMREKPLPAAQVQRAEAALLERIGGLEENQSKAPERWRTGRPKHRGGDEPGSVRGVVPGRSGETGELRTLAEPQAAADVQRPVRTRRRWMAAAAVFVLVGAGLVVYRMLPVRQSLLASGYGQLLSQQLPDGSEVMMNANSRLHYFGAFRNWQDGTDREVWIDGEAYFHVRQTPLKSRFIVHTDRFDIVVTGTQFNVVNRDGRDNVLLQEGSVIVHPQTGEDVHMVPGDFVQWDGTRLEKTPARQDSLTAWQQHQLIFDKTPLRRVAAIIEEQYGVKVTLADPSIGDSVISGILPNNNLNVLLQALETTSDFDVNRDGANITIKASAH